MSFCPCVREPGISSTLEHIMDFKIFSCWHRLAGVTRLVYSRPYCNRALIMAGSRLFSQIDQHCSPAQDFADSHDGMLSEREMSGVVV